MEITSSKGKLLTQEEDFKEVSLAMRSDAFSALVVSVLQEWFLSSDMKALVLLGTIEKLKTKYSEKEIEAFRTGLVEIVNRFQKKNDFMG